MVKNKRKIAVVLCNLGGPDSLKAVRPFLFNLFFDKNIIRVPFLLRLFLASLISRKREKIAQEIYKILGGKSPLLDNTEKQRKALEQALPEGKDKFKCFIMMRYWHPMSDETCRKVKAWNPDEIILLPLYPQFSTTTVRSSIRQWKKSAKRYGLQKPTYSLCCYPTNSGFVKSMAKILNNSIKNIKNRKNWRVLFTAHGLPQKIIDAGDPYPWQVEQTAQTIAAECKDLPEWLVCYQSRVGPLQWAKPYTEDEIIRAGEQRKSLIVVPIAFVSEHSETLVELDCEYRELARESGVSQYLRLPTVSVDSQFIAGLKSEVMNLLNGKKPVNCGKNHLTCPHSFKDCPYHQRRF